MSTRSRQLVVRFATVAGIVFVLAQLIRWTWPGMVTYNAGLAFSWLVPWPMTIVVSGIFLGLVGWWWYRTRSGGVAWATCLGLVFGGGASNLLERLLFYGQVADYINVFNLTTANLADVAIIIGLTCALWRVTRFR